MSVETGLNWLVYVDTADDLESPSWASLPNQQGGGIEFTRNDASANHKGNSGWEDYVTISRGWQIPVNGLADDDNTGMLFLVDTKALSADTDVSIGVKLENADGDTYIGTASIDSIKYDAPFDGLVTYTGSFKGRGSIAVTRAT